MKTNPEPEPESKISGRQRLTWPAVEGMAACASMLGVPEALVKRVKKAGSKAFLSGNRIDTEIIIPELFAAILAEHPTGLVDVAQENGLLAAAKRRALEDEEKLRRGEMHILADVEAKVWTDVLAPLRDSLLNLGRLCGAQCNPANPTLATKVLNDYVQALLAKVAAAAVKKSS